MDPLAHVLVGTLIAKTHPAKSRGLVWACVLGALIPDIDIVLTLFDRTTYITEHRGFTHSLLGFLPMSLLAAYCARFIAGFLRGNRASFKLLCGLASLGVFSHLILDWCTSWGTMLLWPNRTRFALDQLFIIDPWYWLVLTIPLLALFFAKKNRTRYTWIGILAVVGYHGLVAYSHHLAIVMISREWPQAQHLAIPQPFSPFRWSGFNRGEPGLLLNARIDLFKSDHPLGWTKWREPEMTPSIKAAMESPVGKTYLWFARVPMWEEEKGADGTTVVRFWDARFRNYLTEDKLARGFGARFVVKDGEVIESQF